MMAAPNRILALTRAQVALPSTRSRDRFPVAKPARVQWAAGSAEVVLRDLSQQGFRCDCLTFLPAPGPAMLRIAGIGSFPVELVWQGSGAVGGRFAPALTWRGVFAILSNGVVV
jgi:hypothetical protein